MGSYRKYAGHCRVKTKCLNLILYRFTQKLNARDIGCGRALGRPTTCRLSSLDIMVVRHFGFRIFCQLDVVKYPACARLQKIENQSTLVKQNK